MSTDFQVARKGDSLFAPFQCDCCWFQNLHYRNPTQSPLDQLEMELIRRANLDIFWSRAASTVADLQGDFMRLKEIAEQFDLPVSTASQGPWPLLDNVGFDTALVMLWKSLKPGKHSKSFQQFDTIRKMRTVARNIYEASYSGHVQTMTFTDDKKKTYILTNNPTQSPLFRMFIRGCEERMGSITVQNTALSIDVLLCILQNYENEFWDRNTSKVRRRFIVMAACIVIVGYVASLRGGEIFLTEALELCQGLDYGLAHATKYVVLPLRGRFKGEIGGTRNVIFVLAGTTMSGIAVRKWFERWVGILRQEQRDGPIRYPAFCDERGISLSYSLMNSEFQKAVLKVQSHHANLIPQVLDVKNSFYLFRSLRRGSLSRATDAKVSNSVIDTNNRWRKLQTARGKKKLSMSQLYMDITLVLDTRLAFSLAL